MATLKSLVDETTNIKNEIVECRDMLKQILIDKKIEGLENESKLSVLINKVNGLGDYVPPPLYLYNNGDECVDITGGWEMKTWYTTSKLNKSYSKNADHLYFASNDPGSSNEALEMGWFCSNLIDVTNYNKLYIDIDIDIGNSSGTIPSTKVGIFNGSKDVVVSTKQGNRDRETICLDISNARGYYSLGTLNYAGWLSSITSYVYNVWLEM